MKTLDLDSAIRIKITSPAHGRFVYVLARKCGAQYCVNFFDMQLAWHDLCGDEKCLCRSNWRFSADHYYVETIFWSQRTGIVLQVDRKVI